MLYRDQIKVGEIQNILYWLMMITVIVKRQGISYELQFYNWTAVCLYIWVLKQLGSLVYLKPKADIGLDRQTVVL